MKMKKKLEVILLNKNLYKNELFYKNALFN